MITPRHLKELYEQGTNISSVLRKEMGVDHNTREIIEISYDLQTGSYIAAMQDKEMAKQKEEFTGEIARTILSLCKPMSILEAGVGEATTLSGVLQNMHADVTAYGFDLSWSRVAFAKRWLKSKGFSSVILCSGDLLNIPFLDNSIDVVYTSHSIEPNGGSEIPILKELYRVARKYLILLEPGYELPSTSNEARKRMDSHGYCKNLKGVSDSLGFEVLTHTLFPYPKNPLNPTAVTIIRKDEAGELPESVFACPRYKTPLKEIGGMMFSAEACVAYPILGGIPCLRVENGVFASKYEEIMSTDVK